MFKFNSEGQLNPKRKLRIFFFAVSQNYQHFVKDNINILKQIVWELKNDIKI